MRIGLMAALPLGIVLAGCGERDVGYAGNGPVLADFAPEAPETEFGFQEAMNQGPSPFGETGESARMAAGNARLGAEAAVAADETEAEVRVASADGAQIAYSYSYGYRVDSARIGDLQQGHAALCEKMGPQRCRVLGLSRAGSDDDGYGELHMRVAADEARGFGTALDKAAEAVGGEQASFGLNGEDLTEIIVDTEAHLASRRLLRDRLMDVLRTRQGSVGDLIEAERAVAEANEEIDTAASQLANLRGRVRMSAVAIEYGPHIAGDTLGFVRPIGAALGSVGTTLGVTIAVIIYVVVALVPVTALLLLLRWMWRRSGLRLRREKANPEATEA